MSPFLQSAHQRGASPWKFFGGGLISSAWVAGPRAKATETPDPPWPHKKNRPWPPSLRSAMASRSPGSAMASRSPGSAMASRSPRIRHGLPEAPDPPWPPEAPDPQGLPESPVPPWMPSLYPCPPTDIQGAHPPSQVLLLRRGTRRPGGGGTVTEWPVSSVTDHFTCTWFTHHAHLLLIIHSLSPLLYLSTLPHSSLGPISFTQVETTWTNILQQH